MRLDATVDRNVARRDESSRSASAMPEVARRVGRASWIIMADNNSKEPNNPWSLEKLGIAS
jgi:uncharacterized protein (UPF0147 family)